MAMTFNFSALPEQDRALFLETSGLTATGNAVVWACFASGIGWEITETNVEELIGRVRVWEKLLGPFLKPSTSTSSTEIPGECLRAAIGLCVNVAFTPRDEWLASVFAMAFPKCDQEDLGTKRYTVSTFPEFDEELEVHVASVWATSAAQAITKAGRVWRADLGEDYILPPTWEWCVDECVS